MPQVPGMELRGATAIAVSRVKKGAGNAEDYAELRRTRAANGMCWQSFKCGRDMDQSRRRCCRCRSPLSLRSWSLSVGPSRTCKENSSTRVDARSLPKEGLFFFHVEIHHLQQPACTREAAALSPSFQPGVQVPQRRCRHTVLQPLGSELGRCCSTQPAESCVKLVDAARPLSRSHTDGRIWQSV